MTKSQAGKGTAFWFDVDFPEAGLVSRRYGVEAGAGLLLALEDFLRGLPEAALVRRGFFDHFLLLFICERPKSNEEIISLWRARTERFLEERRKKYPGFHLRLCCGVCPIKNERIPEALEQAAMANQEARKADGRETVILTPALIQRLRAQREFAREISRALEEKRFGFYLQPKVELLTGKIVGAEALARRFTRSGEVIYPDTFLPVMEENGTVAELDFLILRGVCEHLARRLAEGLPVVPVSVNLSRPRIERPDTARRLEATVSEYGIPPKLLAFELTENIFLGSLAAVKGLTDQLRDAGYQVSIDDYGTGYTNLGLWKELDFDELKLDKSFIPARGPGEEKNKVIVPIVLELAERMGVKVVCEGVETLGQLEYLRQCGCGIVQGYFFSEPVPPEKFYQAYEDKGGRYPLPGRLTPLRQEAGPTGTAAEPRGKSGFPKAAPARYAASASGIPDKPGREPAGG